MLPRNSKQTNRTKTKICIIWCHVCLHLPVLYFSISYFCGILLSSSKRVPRAHICLFVCIQCENVLVCFYILIITDAKKIICSFCQKISLFLRLSQHVYIFVHFKRIVYLIQSLITSNRYLTEFHRFCYTNKIIVSNNWNFISVFEKNIIHFSIEKSHGYLAKLQMCMIGTKHIKIGAIKFLSIWSILKYLHLMCCQRVHLKNIAKKKYRGI